MEEVGRILTYGTHSLSGDATLLADASKVAQTAFGKY